MNVAKELGADQTIHIDLKSFNVETYVAKVKEALGGQGANVTFECTGNEGSTKVAIYATNNGGKVALVGLGPLEVSAPLVNASLREVDIIGVCRFRNCYPMAIYLLEKGLVNLKPLVTHKYPLERSLDAFNKIDYWSRGLSPATLRDSYSRLAALKSAFVRKFLPSIDSVRTDGNGFPIKQNTWL
ncbi:unnamed protein product [Medioppia subpectinata]|uniref:Alcohol dehydrogenase-like C-terminal domain-containing protein n=1 Tax=Medioppia subpectinata TaxID=1979941 RepID=A0A7R9Q9D8_9ACAR|nr:unnamed protein product [Medioppia subpectinata]CAG2116277.1 unnamed protein product [Medioppia subpectinata]